MLFLLNNKYVMTSECSFVLPSLILSPCSTCKALHSCNRPCADLFKHRKSRGHVLVCLYWRAFFGSLFCWFFCLHAQARLLLSFNLISSVEQAHDFKFFVHFDGGLNVVILRMRVNRRRRHMFWNALCDVTANFRYVNTCVYSVQLLLFFNHLIIIIFTEV